MPRTKQRHGYHGWEEYGKETYETHWKAELEDGTIIRIDSDAKEKGWGTVTVARPNGGWMGYDGTFPGLTTIPEGTEWVEDHYTDTRDYVRDVS